MVIMDELSDKYNYVYSSSLSARIQIKIGTLEGKFKKLEYDKLLANPSLKYSGLCQEGCSDLMVKCQVFDKGKPLAVAVCTSYKPFTTRYSWNEWLTLPVQFSDLPKTAQLALTIYDCIGATEIWPVGGTTVSLFSKNNVFKRGMMDLRVYLNQEADCIKTPGKAKDVGNEQMQRLNKLSKKHRNGHMPKADWVDRLTFRELELINNAEKSASNYIYLMIEFPEFFLDSVPHNIVYFEQNGEDIQSIRAQADIVTVPDQEILKENLEERKHHKLARSLRSGHCDKDAKPNATIRDLLNNIVLYPSTKALSNEEQDHVWKFRFYLSNQKKALTKFLKCVNWTQQNEVRQALSMMKIWAPMDVEDALELLGPNFTHPAVRRYAITRLQQAPDEDIMLYLLQLVQALKYENFKDILLGDSTKISHIRETPTIPEEHEAQLEKAESKDSNSTVTSESVLLKSQISHEHESVVEQNLQHSYVQSIEESITSDQKLPTNLQDNLFNAYTDSANTDTLQNQMNESEDIDDLATFLIRRACKNSKLANYFFWYLIIECEDPDPTLKPNTVTREMYTAVMKAFSQTLQKGTGEMQKKRQMLYVQQKFIEYLVKLVKTVLRESGNRKKKTEKLQQLLADPTAFKFNFSCFDPMPFPLDPDTIVRGIIPEKASLFKSALMPCKLHFVTVDAEEYVAIFKHGDDLRQDQLILQMITLMDKLLRKENLDLKLSPYGVLATSSKHGFVKFIDSVSVAEAVAAEGSIQNYFRKFHPQENGPFGIAPDVMDNYVRSCAGYCVITYLLGVGDRHLDNLLLTTDGKLFHIDFGYILGRDPKPLPPPMKLSKEMVEAMGGVNSEHYQEFRKQCYTAYLHLRRHANLMLNLFSLMVDASVPDIALEPDKAVRKVQDKFRLDLGEEEAVHYIQNLIDSSVSAVMPAIVEQIHKITQYIRK